MTVKLEFNIPDIGTPVIDRSTGLMTPEWYRYFEEFTRQSDVATGQIDLNVTDIASAGAAIEAIGAVTITAGNGLDGGGDIGSGDMTIDAKKDTGWTAGTGTANKGADATYAGQAVSVAYVQAEAQATDNAVKAVHQRVRALENAIRANEGIN